MTNKKTRKKHVLIAHQSSIPHYRAELYNQIQDNIPENFDFQVVDESNLEKRNKFFKERMDLSSLRFNIKKTNSYFFGKTKYHFQSFIFSLWKYDIIIVENALNNLSYPLSIFYKLIGKKVLMWGHGRDLNNPTDNSFLRKFMENLKLGLVKLSDGFLAYTPSVKDYLLEKGCKEKEITVLYNTIDILKVREVKEEVFQTAEKLNKKLVFTGRLTKSKRIEFLIEAFSEIYKRDNDFELHIIGDGSQELKELILAQEVNGVKFYGEVTDQFELANIYKEIDFYMYPGYVGLGVLHAMCFELVPIVIESDYHKPEFDYLNDQNSFILPNETDSSRFAEYILEIYSEKPDLLLDKKRATWDSIKEYTIQKMSYQFIEAITKVI